MIQGVEGGVRGLANGFPAASNNGFCGIFPFNTIKKARAGFPVAPSVFVFYLQTIKSQGGTMT
jgi:hypothetical protein